MKRKKLPVRKNLAPLIIPVAPLIWGGVLGAGTVIATGIGSFMTSEDELKRIKDIDKLIKDLDFYIKQEQMGIKSDVTIKPTSVINPPTQRRQVFLAGAWDATIASTRADGEYKEKLLEQAKNYLNLAKQLPDEEADPQTLYWELKGVDGALKALAQQYGGSTIPQEDKVREMNTNLDVLREQELFEKQNSSKALLEDAMKETVDDGGKAAVLFGEILAGLFTGRKPKGLNAKEWKKVRRRIWIVLGGGLGAFIIPKITPIITPIVKDIVATRRERRMLRAKED